MAETGDKCRSEKPLGSYADFTLSLPYNCRKHQLQVDVSLRQLQTILEETKKRRQISHCLCWHHHTFFR